MKNAYRFGFDKAAEAVGLNGNQLIKAAAGAGFDISDILNSIKNGYNSLNPSMRRGLAGGALSGLGTLALSNGDFGERLRNALLIGSLGGFGTYALDRTGLWNDGVNLLSKNIKKLSMR